jgi:hypothetical protein
VFRVDRRRFLDAFLVCATYFNEAGTVHEQFFAFKIGMGPNDLQIPLEEFAAPNKPLCS